MAQRPLRLTNVARGGGKANKDAVAGLKELERKLQALLPDNPKLKQEIYDVVGQAAVEMRDEMRNQARAAGWSGESAKFANRAVTGEEAINSIFAYSRPRGGENVRRRVSALAGLRKAATMVEWIAGRAPKGTLTKLGRLRKKDPGQRVAMSFATMLEFGTAAMMARPAIRTAVKSARPRIIEAIRSGYRALIEKYSQQ